jgi:hypothetical protein
VAEAVETLHCPSCLSPLLDKRQKRCPDCHARIGASARPVGLDESAGNVTRPLLLVERELEARIEAETAARYRERRRAAKTARRIAALPPTLFEADADAASAMASIVIDLPAEAIHEVVVPEPVAEPKPAIELPPVADPDPVEEPEPAVSATPIAAANWQRSDSLWTAKVFNSSPGVRQTEKVTWPRGWTPVQTFDDLVDESSR